MNKHLFVVATLLMLMARTSAQTNAADWYSIKGFMPAWNNANVQLFINGNLVYNGEVFKDLFSYTGPISETKEGLLKITRNRQTIFLPLFIEPGTIKIRDEGKKLVAYGTTTNETYLELMHQFDSLSLLQKQLSFDDIKKYKRQLATVYIQQHPNSPISLKLLADYFYMDASANDTLYYQLYNSLDTSIRNSNTGKKLESEVNLRYTVANGRQAPVISLPDSNHLTLPIYQKGSFTLINFWASSCLPCKREHPTLIKLYNRFKAQHFTIVGISLDTNRSAWLNAVKTEQLEWLQLNDLKGFQSPSAALYGVKLIPFNIFLDASGTIIGKNLSLTEIEAILTKSTGSSTF